MTTAWDTKSVMRATLGATARATDDPGVIEVIDADPAAFGPAVRAPARPSSPTHRASRRRMRRATLALLVAVGAAAVVATRPWEPSAVWRTFPLEVGATTLPAQLVLAQPATPLFSVLHDAQPTSAALADDGLGHVFAAPGATYERGRWALFRIDQITGGSAATVAVTAEAAVVEAAAGGRSRLVWSPSPTRRYTVETQELTSEETRAFGTAVGEHAGHAALRRAYTLGDLQPVAGVGALIVAQQLLDGLARGATAGNATIVRYRGFVTPTSVSTVEAPADAVSAVGFLLGGSPASVNDHPGVTAASPTLGTVVAWVQGGRLVVVTDAVPQDDLLRVAAAVQPATDSTHPFNSSTGGEATTVDVVVGSGVSAGGRSWTATAHFGRATTHVCVAVDNGQSNCRRDVHATLPRIHHVSSEVGDVVVVFSNAANPGSVMLRGPDESEVLLPLQPLVWNIAATAFVAAPEQSYTLVAGDAPREAGPLQPDVTTR